MRAEIEDLEALKELSDELEENHVETEKALQEEIGRMSSPRPRNARILIGVRTRGVQMRRIC
jgi:hypothetical protein